MLWSHYLKFVISAWQTPEAIREPSINLRNTLFQSSMQIQLLSSAGFNKIESIISWTITWDRLVLYCFPQEQLKECVTYTNDWGEYFKWRNKKFFCALIWYLIRYLICYHLHWLRCWLKVIHAVSWKLRNVLSWYISDG